MKAPYFNKSDCDLVRTSGFFDPEWYLERYRDVLMVGMDPIEHFLWLGWQMGRDPGPLFSTAAYLDANQDIQAAGMNALLHYLQNGKAEGRVLRPGQVSMAADDPAHKRVAVFASFSAEGVVEDYVKIYLTALSKVCDHVVFVVDNDLTLADQEYLGQTVSHVIAGRHGEYDFGSYKRGIEYARTNGLLDGAAELVLCNDSCYGPFQDLGDFIAKMELKNLDFWGITQNSQFGDHIQSYFIVFKRRMFTDLRFVRFFESVSAKDHVSKVVLTYEVPMTRHFADMGFSWGTLIDNETPGYTETQKIKPNITTRPLFKLDAGSPFIKVKAFKTGFCNHEGMERSLKRVRETDRSIHDAILTHVDASRFYGASKVAFSLIMPFHNRRDKIAAAIDSVLAQTHQNFELVLIDDGSTDGAADFVHNKYRTEFAAGRMVLVPLEAQQGVSAARNAGLGAARYGWIGYVDSDNEIDSRFLETFAEFIIEHPKHKTLYSWLRLRSSGAIVGDHYDRTKLIDANFIDLGAFVHSKEITQQLGGFDVNLKRLVDWDLIIRYTASNFPVCISRPLLTYSDNEADTSRISVRVPLDDAKVALRKKHSMPFLVTTIIPTYRHKEFVAAAIESALAQKGHVRQQILICDDGSDDGTKEIIARFAKEHPKVIRDIGTPNNRGISENFRVAISRSIGDFIAILEGDDIWTDTYKLHKQSQFLADNLDCSMVFSKIKVRDGLHGQDRFLERQEKLSTNKLDGSDFLAEASMNLIANFSSCMFKADLLRRAPARLYQGRFNEIALAFYMERHGKIGFLKEAMSVYHQHANGVWSGSSKEAQLESGLETRRMVLDVADAKYAPTISQIIEENYRKPLGLIAV